MQLVLLPEPYPPPRPSSGNRQQLPTVWAIPGSSVKIPEWNRNSVKEGH
jgi:hypothetical protein